MFGQAERLRQEEEARARTWVDPKKGMKNEHMDLLHLHLMFVNVCFFGQTRFAGKKAG